APRNRRSFFEFRASSRCTRSTSACASCYAAAMEPPSPDTQQVFTPGMLRDQIAIVTGGGSGLGLATAPALAPLGARLAICGRNAGKLDAAARALREAGAAVLAQPCDIREPAQVEAFVAAVLAEHGRIDILVNNAGGQFASPAQHISPNGFLAVVRN